MPKRNGDTPDDVDEETVRYTVELPKRLRDDAKRNCEHGELAEGVRDLFRRKAYGSGGTGPTETERLQAELRDVRSHIDSLRASRSKTEAEIQAQETRATRLEERVTSAQDSLDDALNELEPALKDGERMWPTWIKNKIGCSPARGEELHRVLKERNPDLPEAAFTEPGVPDPVDWRDAK